MKIKIMKCPPSGVINFGVSFGGVFSLTFLETYTFGFRPCACAPYVFFSLPLCLSFCLFSSRINYYRIKELNAPQSTFLGRVKLYANGRLRNQFFVSSERNEADCGCDADEKRNDECNNILTNAKHI